MSVAISPKYLHTIDIPYSKVAIHQFLRICYIFYILMNRSPGNTKQHKVTAVYSTWVSEHSNDKCTVLLCHRKRDQNISVLNQA